MDFLKYILRNSDLLHLFMYLFIYFVLEKLKAVEQLWGNYSCWSAKCIPQAGPQSH